jgi:uncharacterized protein YjbI with pentapeptide repeats
MLEKSDKSFAVQICELYATGERHFSQANLKKANLEQAFLSNIDLSNSELTYANLEKADLSNGFFGASSFVKTNLFRANLWGADFTKADLTGANLTGAILVGANFAHANLNNANLSVSRLLEAEITNKFSDKIELKITKSPQINFQGANLAGAFCIGADLSFAQLEGAFFDEKTHFDSSFDPIKAGMINMRMSSAIALDKLLAQFNNLITTSNRYLGPTITSKYFNSSRLDYDWLNQFQINSRNHVSFRGTISSFVSLEQLDYFQQWMDSFTQSCSKIIRNFPGED